MATRWFRTTYPATVITVQRFTGDDEAVGLANGLSHGIGSSMWAKDRGGSMRASRMNVGVVWINAHVLFITEMPDGGFKPSGYGKGLSMYGFEE
jgi:betaine-aldehyde dehydrogenase